MNNTFCIHWIGPFCSIDTLKEWERNNQDITSNFYIVTGKRKGKRFITRYFGITKQDYVHLRFNKYHKIHDLSRDTNIWIGHFTDNELAIRDNIELCESMIISYWQPEENIRKKVYYPPYSVFLINRWYKTNRKLRKATKYPVQEELPDVIIYEALGNEIYGAERLKKLVSIK